jgi:DNA repair exonuclease SbcCD ATPase subunit
MERKDLDKTCMELSDKIKDYESRLNQINYEIQTKERIVNGNGICQYSGKPCAEISNMLAQFSTDINTLKETFTKLQTDKNNLIAEYTSKMSRFDSVSDHINDYKTLSNKVAHLTSLLVNLPSKPNTDKTDIELAQEIKMLQDDRAKVIANQKYNETIDDLTARKAALELELSMIKAWVKVTDTNNLQTQIMQQPFQELADKMTKYIQTMYSRNDITANFIVSEKANSFSFGLNRGSQYISYDLLSSGEKCLYAIALMICIIDNSTSPLKVLMLDDSLDNLDDVAIESTFKSLKNINNIQFILAGVKYCNNAEDAIVKVEV